MKELKNNENLINNTLNTVIEVPVVEDDSKSLKENQKFYATGRRKQAVARLWLSFGKGFEVNKKSFKDYFHEEALISEILYPLILSENKNPLNVKIYSTVSGGGLVAQAGALKLALARALVLFDKTLKSLLKSANLLTRDARKKEREHYGFRTSRKPQQYKRR